MKKPEEKQAFISGVQALLPLIPGVIPFGLVTGITATEQGLSPLTTMGMTLLFYAGSAQLVALQLLREDVLPLVILFTVLVVNLRFMMYSASIAPHVHSLPRRWKWPLSYMLSDQAYALSILKFTAADASKNVHYFFAGTAIAMWLSWIISVMLGIVLGTGIPASWSLDFAIPLAFLAILVPAIKNSPHLAAASVGGLVAVLAIDAPYNLGLLLAAICGILAGVTLEQLQLKADSSADNSSADNKESS
ncbi:AzlC family ABC transporter permease [Marinobacterium sp. D7]|uniref:AzlC family ABC transporter permease n=1 Tax=Marinobacterium ramblicola TaxID=2849041 RepID=UPI001C2D5834|nr:AzlC family ABC transporter permease [Marinobacterium ramblicola]MBV1787333.1 AzlC family ABC transporter permease [Marinobacterium ramblicola]